MKRQFFVLQWLGIFRSATPAILLRFASQLDLNRLQIKGLIVFRQNLYFLSRRGARFLRKLHFHNPSSIQHNDLLQRGIKSLGKKSFQLDIERKIWCGSRYILADALMICNRNRVLILEAEIHPKARWRIRKKFRFYKELINRRPDLDLAIIYFFDSDRLAKWYAGQAEALNVKLQIVVLQKVPT